MYKKKLFNFVDSFFKYFDVKNFSNTFPLDQFINFFLDHPVGNYILSFFFKFITSPNF